MNYALPTDRFASSRPTLSDNERLVLTCALRGMRYKEVFPALGLNENTYKDILRRVKTKLGARSTTHAVALAFAWGLISFDYGDEGELKTVTIRLQPRTDKGRAQ